VRPSPFFNRLFDAATGATIDSYAPICKYLLVFDPKKRRSPYLLHLLLTSGRTHGMAKK
jgi:hypothetical protein